MCQRFPRSINDLIYDLIHFQYEITRRARKRTKELHRYHVLSVKRNAKRRIRFPLTKVHAQLIHLSLQRRSRSCLRQRHSVKETYPTTSAIFHTMSPSRRLHDLQPKIYPLTECSNTNVQVYASSIRYTSRHNVPTRNKRHTNRFTTRHSTSSHRLILTPIPPRRLTFRQRQLPRLPKQTSSFFLLRYPLKYVRRVLFRRCLYRLRSEGGFLTVFTALGRGAR